MDMVKLWQLGCVKAYNTVTTFSEQQLREVNLKSQIFMEYIKLESTVEYFWQT